MRAYIGERIAKAKNESEIWKVINEIPTPNSNHDIKLTVDNKLISDEKEVTDTLINYFIDKVKNHKRWN